MADPTQATKNWPDPDQKFLTRTHHFFDYDVEMKNKF